MKRLALFEQEEPSAVPDAPVEVSKPWIGPHGRRMQRLELHLTYTCPERCSFCSEDHRMKQYRGYPVTFARVATVLRRHAERGVTNLHVTGGEPTIHPDFVQVLALAKKLGMRTSVGTIGTRMLTEAAWARLGAMVWVMTTRRIFCKRGSRVMR